MAFHVTNRMGTMSSPPISAFPALLGELKESPEDQEHCSVSVTHDSEWCLDVYSGGYVVWENLADGAAPRHMRDVSDEKLLCLWQALASGNIESIEREPWLPGY